MSQFLEQSGLFDQVIRLGPEERKSPCSVIERFFADYRLHEWRHHLWNMMEACLTSSNEAFNDPEERANLLLRYQDLEKLLEAAFLIHQDRNNSCGNQKKP